MRIPFVDLKAQYNSIKNEINTAIQNVIDETAFIKGVYVKKFEAEYAEANGVKHCISCANGTDAIYITLKALGIGSGDEVITVANTWISTAETITQTGAKPVFVDIHPKYYTIDVSKIEKKITPKTKAIIPVHLFGQPAEIDLIKSICDRYDLLLIEDCAQAHFAEWTDKKVGTFGMAGTFSFYPSKNLGAFGDAGAIITNDREFSKKARMFANHGASIKHQHNIEGINSRLDGLQAAILSVKLKYIHDWNNKRLEHAKKYNQLLKEVDGLTCPEIHRNAKHVFHLYVIQVENRNNLQQLLENKGISTYIHYPTPLPFLKAYSYLKLNKEDFPIALQHSNNILSLPMYPELTDDSIYYIVNTLKNVLN